MKKTNPLNPFDLVWLEPKDGDIFRETYCYIVVGGQRISVKCVAPGEVQESVRYLKRDLDELLKEAERKYAAYQRRRRPEWRSAPNQSEETSK